MRGGLSRAKKAVVSVLSLAVFVMVFLLFGNRLLVPLPSRHYIGGRRAMSNVVANPDVTTLIESSYTRSLQVELCA